MAELGGIRGYFSQQELAHALGLTKGAVSKHVAKLMAEGLVRNEVGLFVTRKGAEKVEKAFGWEPLTGVMHIEQSQGVGGTANDGDSPI